MKRKFSAWRSQLDGIFFFLLLLLIGTGCLLSFAASPSVAKRIGLDSLFFVKKHVLMSVVTLVLCLLCSCLSGNAVRAFCVLGYCSCIMLLIMTIFSGIDTKGAKRWVMVFGNSLQASEIVKPFLSGLCAWILCSFPEKKGFYICCGIIFVPILFIIMQPDFGMSFLIIITFMFQIFVAGIPIFWLLGMLVMSGAGCFSCYYFLPHVKKRIDQFFSPSLDTQVDLYQVQKSLQAFGGGGWFGKGPGEGSFKDHVPDVHADFIFSVAGEEFGFIGCLIILVIFMGLIARIFYQGFRQMDRFTLLFCCGIGMSLFIQCFINISSSLHLIPTKGMTLPFLSYGGSSMISLSIGIGMILALRQRNISHVVQNLDN